MRESIEQLHPSASQNFRIAELTSAAGIIAILMITMPVTGPRDEESRLCPGLSLAVL